MNKTLKSLLLLPFGLAGAVLVALAFGAVSAVAFTVMLYLMPVLFVVVAVAWVWREVDAVLWSRKMAKYRRDHPRE